MQRGFLGKPSAKGPNAETNDPTKPTHATEEQLQECLALLRGPGDERKLVGLLMVTRALPGGDLATVKQVYNAVGPSFLARLLLPLRKTPNLASQQQPQPPLDEETAQRQIGMAALGLAVLSSAAQVEEIASSPEFIQLTPLFLNVARAGGVSPLIIASSESVEVTSLTRMDPQTDEAAVRDALECAAAVAFSGEEGRQIAEESGALHAAAYVLLRFSEMKPTKLTASDENTNPRSLYEAELWAIRLTTAVLVANGPDRAATIAENSDAIEALVPGLAYALALPALLRQETAKRGAAVLHLESLHALLLILPLPLPEAFTAYEFLRQDAIHSLWSRHIRLGIGLILRGKAAAVQRHSALQLAAALVGMIGPQWLYCPLGTSSTSNNLEEEEKEGGAFYQLLVEVVKVETNVLLYDALSPESHVPLSSEPGVAAKDWTAPPPTSATLGGNNNEEDDDDHDHDIEEEIETIEQSAKKKEEEKSPQRGGGGGSAGGAQNNSVSVSSVVDGIDIDPQHLNTNIWAHGPSESAGERALKVLPCCFVLLEAAIEALAEDNDSDENFSDGSSSSRVQRGLLSDAVAERALASLLECIDVLLQVLEEEVEEEGNEHDREPVVRVTAAEAEEGADETRKTPTLRNSNLSFLKLGAVRVLGRFFAEVPDAFEDRVRKGLPRLLAISSDDNDSTTNSTFLVSVPISSLPGSPKREDTLDSILDSFGDFIHQVQSPKRTTRKTKSSSGGISFFLPMLLQVTDPIRPTQREDTHISWIESIVRGGSLRQLVDFAVETADAILDQRDQDDEEESQKEDLEEMEASFMIVCRVLLQLITQIEQLVQNPSSSTSPSAAAVGASAFQNFSRTSFTGEGPVALEFAVADASWPLIPTLSEVLSAYFSELMPTNAEERVEVDSSLKGKIACVAALLAVVLEVVADEDDHPDEAHLSQHELFRRKSSHKISTTAVAGASGDGGAGGAGDAGDEVLSGMGPVSGEDVQLASEMILSSMHFMNNCVNLQENTGDNNQLFKVEEDHRCLMVSAKSLLKSCAAFRDAVQHDSEGLFKELTLV